MGWLTNSPELAKKLRYIDAEYERVRASASCLPLRAKLDVFRVARINRDLALKTLIAELE